MAETQPVALITGASRGLGRAIALEFARQGYRLALTARSAEGLEQTRLDVEAEAPVDVLTMPADLRERTAPGEVVEVAVGRFGRLDVLVNNAGDTKRGDFLALTDDDHLSGFSLKYHAMVRACRSAWPHLVASSGAIVNVSGVSGQTPEPEFTVGGPVNAAIVNFSKALARRAGGGRPRVNVVCPGHIVTDRLQQRIEAVARRDSVDRDEARERLRRSLGIDSFGEPEDIARAVCFLASPAARYVHGSVFVVDGGATPGV
ncbi:SDR family oxidoreductase [Rubrimonas sp.]|uniref:SDR family oxidoreductase n=1 Tax=Rubrimonas sp. TaxID=2036015 RepID=UPI002FDD980D